MEQVTLTATAVITEVSGQVSVIDVKGNVRGVIPGDPIYPGELIITSSGSQVEFEYFDVKQALSEGCITCIPTSKTSEALHASHADILALQRAIAKGLDPSDIAKATSSGHVLVSSDGAILVERDNAQILAEGEYHSVASPLTPIDPYLPIEVHPTDLNNDYLTVTEDVGGIVDVLANDGQLMPSDLTIINVVKPDHGEVTLNDDGTIYYKPDSNYNGPDTITYTVENEQGVESTATVSIDVVADNDSPESGDVLVNGLPIGEDALIPVTEAGDVVNGQLTGTDVEDDAAGIGLTYTLVGNAPSGFELNSDGSFSFDPKDPSYEYLAEGQDLPLNLVVTVSDSGGKTDTVELNITITGTDDAPSISGSFTGSVIEGDIGQIEPETAEGTLKLVDLDDNFVFADLNTNGDIEGTYGTLNLQGDDWVYTLDQNKVQFLADGEQAQDAITLEATTSDGKSEIQIITISIEGTNDQPQVNNVSVEHDIADGNSISGNFSASDLDASDELSYEIVTQPSGFVIENNGDGSFSFDPGNSFEYLKENESTTLTFKYQVTDDSGQANAASEISTGSIIITGENDAVIVNPPGPTIGALSDQLTAEGESFSYTIPDDAFVDPEGETIHYEVSLADGSPLPDWLTFDAATHTFSGTPAVGDIGNLDVKVTALDPYNEGVAVNYDLTVLKAVDAKGGELERDAAGAAGEVYDLKGSGDISLNYTITADSESSYQNSYGYYFVDASGNPIEGKLLILDTQTIVGTETREINISANEIPSNAVSIGFFLVPDGYSDAYHVNDDVPFDEYVDVNKAEFSTNQGNIDNVDYKVGAHVDFKLNSEGIYEAFVGGNLVTANGPQHGNHDAHDTQLVFTQSGLMNGDDQELSLTNPLGDYTMGDRPGVNNVDDLYISYEIKEASTVVGSAENEWLRGSDNDDSLFGGEGNDILTGGAGSDDFVWLQDHHGSVAEPQQDIIRDFSLSEDHLDLSELLTDETSSNLDQYLSFETKEVDVDGVSRTDTVISVSHDGVVGDTDLSITLNGVDLVAEYGSNQTDIISGLLDNHVLIVG